MSKTLQRIARQHHAAPVSSSPNRHSHVVGTATAAAAIMARGSSGSTSITPAGKSSNSSANAGGGPRFSISTSHDRLVAAPLDHSLTHQGDGVSSSSLAFTPPASPPSGGKVVVGGNSGSGSNSVNLNRRVFVTSAKSQAMFLREIQSALLTPAEGEREASATARVAGGEVNGPAVAGAAAAVAASSSPCSLSSPAASTAAAAPSPTPLPPLSPSDVDEEVERLVVNMHLWLSLHRCTTSNGLISATLSEAVRVVFVSLMRLGLYKRAYRLYEVLYGIGVKLSQFEITALFSMNLAYDDATATDALMTEQQKRIAEAKRKAKARATAAHSGYVQRDVAGGCDDSASSSAMPMQRRVLRNREQMRMESVLDDADRRQRQAAAAVDVAAAEAALMSSPCRTVSPSVRAKAKKAPTAEGTPADESLSGLNQVDGGSNASVVVVADGDDTTTMPTPTCTAGAAVAPAHNASSSRVSPLLPQQQHATGDAVASSATAGAADKATAVSDSSSSLTTNTTSHGSMGSASAMGSVAFEVAMGELDAYRFWWAPAPPVVRDAAVTTTAATAPVSADAAIMASSVVGPELASPPTDGASRSEAVPTEGTAVPTVAFAAAAAEGTSAGQREQAEGTTDAITAGELRGAAAKVDVAVPVVAVTPPSASDATSGSAAADSARMAEAAPLGTAAAQSTTVAKPCLPPSSPPPRPTFTPRDDEDAFLMNLRALANSNNSNTTANSGKSSHHHQHHHQQVMSSVAIALSQWERRYLTAPARVCYTPTLATPPTKKGSFGGVEEEEDVPASKGNSSSPSSFVYSCTVSEALRNPRPPSHQKGEFEPAAAVGVVKGSIVIDGGVDGDALIHGDSGKVSPFKPCISRRAVETLLVVLAAVPPECSKQFATGTLAMAAVGGERPSSSLTAPTITMTWSPVNYAFALLKAAAAASSHHPRRHYRRNGRGNSGSGVAVEDKEEPLDSVAAYAIAAELCLRHNNLVSLAMRCAASGMVRAEEEMGALLAKEEEAMLAKSNGSKGRGGKGINKSSSGGGVVGGLSIASLPTMSVVVPSQLLHVPPLPPLLQTCAAAEGDAAADADAVLASAAKTEDAAVAPPPPPAPKETRVTLYDLSGPSVGALLEFHHTAKKKQQMGGAMGNGKKKDSSFSPLSNPHSAANATIRHRLEDIARLYKVSVHAFGTHGAKQDRRAQREAKKRRAIVTAMNPSAASSSSLSSSSGGGGGDALQHPASAVASQCFLFLPKVHKTHSLFMAAHRNTNNTHSPLHQDGGRGGDGHHRWARDDNRRHSGGPSPSSPSSSSPSSSSFAASLRAASASLDELLSAAEAKDGGK